MFNFKQIEKLSREFNDARREFNDEDEQGFWPKYLCYVKEAVDDWRAADGGLTHAACDTISAAAWYCRNKEKPTYEDYFDEDFGIQHAAELFDFFCEDYYEASSD